MLALGGLPGLLPLEGESGEPQVQNLQYPIAVNQQVRGLDVAMDEASRVGMGQAFGRLADKIGRLAVLQRTALLHQLPQVLPVDIFHHQVMNRFAVAHILVEVVRPNDVRVVELGDGLGFEMEATEQFGIVLIFAWQDFDRATAVHHLVLGQKDLAHPPLTQRPENAIGAEVESASFPSLQIVGLPLGQYASPDQFVGQGASALRLGPFGA